MEFTELEYVGPLREGFKEMDVVYDEAIGRDKKVSFQFLMQSDGRLIAKNVPVVTAHNMVRKSDNYELVVEGQKNKILKVNLKTVDKASVLEEKVSAQDVEIKKLKKQLMREKQAGGKVENVPPPPKTQEAARLTPRK